jgi:hypothetical protein
MHRADLEKLITDYGSPWILHEKVGGATEVAARDNLAAELAQANIRIETLEAANVQLQADCDKARREVQRLKQS